MIGPLWWLESGPMREFPHSRQEFNGMLIVFGLRAGYTGNNIVSEVRGTVPEALFVRKEE